jgi:hypothetical protein
MRTPLPQPLEERTDLNSPRMGYGSAPCTAFFSASGPLAINTSFASLSDGALTGGSSALPSSAVGHLTRQHRSRPSRRASSSDRAWPGPSESVAMMMRTAMSSTPLDAHR